MAEREALLTKLHEEMERDLEILGGTAIEDKLQDGVPETIRLLREAGIKIWMLTGDKQETAINIGLSCNLFSHATVRHVVQATSSSSSAEALRDEVLRMLQGVRAQPNLQHGLVIDGQGLLHALSGPVKADFLDLCCLCSSVICCRVSPQQKADVVSLVQAGRKVVTLAVGDGANDVSMIQRASVGVGISGLEGKQAVMSSDYAIGRFRFLQRLILVHGRWCYLRCSEMTLVFFFKNVVFVMPIFWYQFVCGFSAQTMYHFANQMFYNLIYTSLPVIAIASLDQEVGPAYTLRYPWIYEMGPHRRRFNRRIFWLQILDGAWQSAMCFLLPYLIYGVAGGAQAATGGHTTYLYQLGNMMAACVVIAANTSVAFNARTWNVVTAVAYALSILGFFVIPYLVDRIAKPTSDFTWDYYQLGEPMFRTPLFWLTLLVTVMAAFLPRFIMRAAHELFSPDSVDVIREVELLGLDRAPTEGVPNPAGSNGSGNGNGNRNGNGNGNSSNNYNSSSSSRVDKSGVEMTTLAGSKSTQQSVILTI